MGKNKGKPRNGGEVGTSSKGGGGASGSSAFFGSRGVLIAFVGVGIAVGLQFALTAGYLSPPSAPSRSGLRSTDAKKKASDKRSLPPAICPEDWKECPKVAGIDWVALEAAEASPHAMPSFEALAGCHAPSTLLSPRKVPGMHLLCVLPPPAGADAPAAVSTVAIFAHMDGRTATSPSAVLLLPKLKKAEHAVAAVARKLRFRRKGPLYQPAAIFNERGIRLKTASLLAFGGGAGGAGGAGGEGGARRLLCMEGGQWLWPPVDVGHVHEIADLTAPGVITRVVTVSLQPLVVEVENFLNLEEAQHIVERAKPHMAKSGVALKDVDRGKAAKEFRTSSQYFLPTTRDALLERVDKRVMELTRIPISHAEYIQVLRYNHLEHYSAHHDFFDPAAYASNAEMLASVEHGAKNRMATVFFYLNNVTNDADVTKGGGQTNFPRAATTEFPNGGPQPRDYFDCSKGLSVYPQAGKVIIFYSMLPNGEMDDYSLHGGCDVLDEQATKWSANFWLWNKPYHFMDPARQRATQELMDGWL